MYLPGRRFESVEVSVVFGLPLSGPHPPASLCGLGENLHVRDGLSIVIDDRTPQRPRRLSVSRHRGAEKGTKKDGQRAGQKPRKLRMVIHIPPYFLDMTHIHSAERDTRKLEWMQW